MDILKSLTLTRYVSGVKMKLFFSTLLKLATNLFIVTLLSGCTFGSSFIESRNSSQSLQNFEIVPNSKILVESSDFTFAASGGNGSYSYSIISGEGSIDPITGRYTAPTTITSSPNVVIQATDSLGRVSTATIALIGTFRASNTTVTQDHGVGKVAPLRTVISGGVAPYSYRLVSGVGSIDSTTGNYTMPSQSGSAVVEIEDTMQNAVTVNLNVEPTTFNSWVSSTTTDGTSLFAAGMFNQINPFKLHGFAQIDGQTAELTAEECQFKTTIVGGIIKTIPIGNSLYILGSNMTAINGTTVQNLAKLDLNTCLVDTTFSQTTGISGGGPAFEMIASGDYLYVGGSFTSYRGTPVLGLVKISLTTGNLDTEFTQATGFNVDWYSSYIVTLEVVGTSLYVGGNFTSYRGSPALGAAKLDLTTGNLNTTFTQATGFSGSGYVGKLLHANGALYATGSFTGYRGANKVQNIAKLDLTSGDLDTTFSQAIGFSSMPESIVSMGTSIFVVGNFTTYRGATVRGLVKLDKDSGALDSVFSQDGGVGIFDNLAVRLIVNGSSLFISGSFSKYRGTSVGYLVKIDANSGALDSTFNKKYLSTYVSNMDVSGNNLWISNVTTYKGTYANGLAKLNPTTFAVDTAFTQSVGLEGGSGKVIKYFNSSIYLVTSEAPATYRGANITNGFIKLDPNNGNMDSGFVSQCAYASGVNQSNTFANTGTSLVFLSTGACNTVAKINWNTGVKDPTFNSAAAFNFGSWHWALAADANYIYIGGQNLTTYGGQAVYDFFRINATTGAYDAGFLAPEVHHVYEILTANNSVYILGIMAGTIQSLMKVSQVDGALDTTFTISGSGVIGFTYNLLNDGSSIYVGGGDITSYRGSPLVTSILRLDQNSGDSIAGFNAPRFNPGYSFGLDPIIIGPYIYYVGGAVHRYDKLTGLRVY